MTDIKPGDKFNIRHETHGSGEGVWSGPYECEATRLMFGKRKVVYQGEDKFLWDWEDNCVKVDDDIQDA